MTARRDGARGQGDGAVRAVCGQCDGNGWIGDDLVTGDWSRQCPTCDGTGTVGNEAVRRGSEATKWSGATEFPHHWQYGRFTGTRTCEACGLLPLDASDVVTDCPGYDATGDTK